MTAAFIRSVDVIDENREQPLFRGINKETNQWVYGFGWYKTEYTEKFLFELKQSEQDAVLLTETGSVICLLNTMGQFTGIFDKNGKKAFENDLFYWHEALRRIVYRKDKGAYMAKRLGDWQKSYFYLNDLADRFEIIGDSFNNYFPAEKES